MRPAVTMAALIDDKGASRDFDLISAKVIDHLGPLDGLVQTAFGHRPHIHRANARGSTMQNQELAVGFLGHIHRSGQNRRAVGLAQGALPDDDNRWHLFDVGEFMFGQLVERRAIRAHMHVIIGQIRRRTDQGDIGAFGPCLADPRVQHRRLVARVGADQHDIFRVINVFDRRRAHIGRTVARRQFRAIRAAFDRPAQTGDHLLERESRLDRSQITDQTGDFLALHGGGGGAERLAPSGFAQLAVLSDIGRIKALAAQPVPNETGLVGNPFLVHAVMVARQNPHHFAPLRIDANIRSQRIHHIDALGLAQFPRPRRKGIGLGGQRAHGAQVDDIALHIAVERLVQIGDDLAVLAAAGLAHLGDARHFGGETHAAGARNAARHRRAHKRAEVDVIHGALWLFEPRLGNAVGHGLILKVAFAALIANRAIERVVDEDKFHHPFARLFHHRRIGFHHGRLPLGTRAQILDLHRAGGRRFGRAADHFDKAHAAIARDGQTLVIAKTRHFHARLLTGLNQGHRPVHFNLLVVDNDLA